ncbi:phenylacetate--CoA ligase family protein [Microbispora sp. H10670]|uniref:phenylacetate--CoA ligase family protein n=1 Tax=Microbispora sp. H10670 TaxID=2729108 RepID=UPI0016026D61|nr:phenylacetate--CoA ligase family protein [Microbispora sp. H10670]
MPGMWLEAGYRQSSFDGAVAEIGFAYDNVPFYRAHLDAAGLRPGDILGPDDLRRVPLTEKADYRRNFPRGVLARGKTLRTPLTLKSQSSGTGGERLTTITHTYDLAARMRTTLSVNKPLLEALSGCRQQRPARYAAPNCSDVECATPFTTMHDRLLPDGTLVLPVSHDLLATPDQLVRQAIDELDEFQPQWFYADATHLAFLVRRFRERKLPPPPVSAIALTYTMVTHVARRQLRDFFGTGIPSAEIVSMTEMGWVAMECHLGNMHINNKSFHTEFMVGSRPARFGERGELVITSIGDRLLPHLRYRTGDIYRLGRGPCDCGSSFPLARLEGRRQNMIPIPGGGEQESVSARQVNDCVGDAPGIDVYRLHQAVDGSLLFQYIPSAHRRSMEDEVTERLRGLLGTGSRLMVEAVAYIPSERSGKFASCTSDLSSIVVNPENGGGVGAFGMRSSR